MRATANNGTVNRLVLHRPRTMRLRVVDPWDGACYFDCQQPWDPRQAANGSYSKTARLLPHKIAAIYSDRVGCRKLRLRVSFA